MNEKSEGLHREKRPVRKERKINNWKWFCCGHPFLIYEGVKRLKDQKYLPQTDLKVVCKMLSLKPIFKKFVQHNGSGECTSRKSVVVLLLDHAHEPHPLIIFPS